MDSETTHLVDSKSEEAQPTLRDKLLKIAGYLCGILGVVFLTVSFACVQALGKSVPGFELNVWRFGVQLAGVVPIVIIKKLDVRVPREYFLYVIIASLFFYSAAFTFYETAKYLSAGTEGCLLPTLLLVIVSPISAILTKECRLLTLAAVIMCITGSVLYVQPEFIFGDKLGDLHPLCGDDVALEQSDDTWKSSRNETDSGLPNNGTEVAESTSNELIIGYTYAIVQAISASTLALVTNRKLGTISPLVMSFWVALPATVISVIGMLSFETPVFPTNGVCVALLLGHALTGGVAVGLYMGAMALLEPTMFALIETLTTLTFCIAQYTVLKDISPARGNALEIVGVLAVLFGNFLGPFYKMYTELKEDNGKKEVEHQLHPIQ